MRWMTLNANFLNSRQNVTLEGHIGALIDRLYSHANKLFYRGLYIYGCLLCIVYKVVLAFPQFL